MRRNFWRNTFTLFETCPRSSMHTGCKSYFVLWLSMIRLKSLPADLTVINISVCCLFLKFINNRMCFLFILRTFKFISSERNVRRVLTTQWDENVGQAYSGNIVYVGYKNYFLFNHFVKNSHVTNECIQISRWLLK